MTAPFDREPENPGEGAVHDEDLLRLLVCPADHARLILESQTLVCTVCGRRYPIEDGVPNMLLESP